ncbi:MAG: PorP/SprF family type IX secretion system membrane protein [Chitinophagales bacterium]|nr:PorP/SprF family type IX secretion system membrane protein [Chitinophagales bacterium]
MKRRLLCAMMVCFGLGVTVNTVQGQDIHFSQYNQAPLMLNPALAGVNGGDFRFVANYKSQWANIGKFNTFAASYDMAVFRKTVRSNFGGIGLSFFSDRAGDLGLSTNQANLNLSYTVLLNHKGTQTLTGGIMGGFGSRSINLSKLTTDSQFGDQGYNPNLPTGENIVSTNKLFADIGAGLLWNYTKDNNTNFYGGFAVSHLNQPNLSLTGNRNEKLFIKITIHGGSHFALSKQLYLLPNLMILNQGPHWEYNFGSLLKIKKSTMPNEKTAFYIGASYRVKDALIFAGRIDIGGFNIGLSYDLNISKLTPASNMNGGPEISFIYAGNWPNKKKSVTYCPML